MEPQYLNARGAAPSTAAEVIAIGPGPLLKGTVTVASSNTDDFRTQRAGPASPVRARTGLGATR
jgi:hypothetical protein